MQQLYSFPSADSGRRTDISDPDLVLLLFIVTLLLFFKLVQLVCVDLLLTELMDVFFFQKFNNADINLIIVCTEILY